MVTAPVSLSASAPISSITIQASSSGHPSQSLSLPYSPLQSLYVAELTLTGTSTGVSWTVSAFTATVNVWYTSSATPVTATVSTYTNTGAPTLAPSQSTAGRLTLQLSSSVADIATFTVNYTSFASPAVQTLVIPASTTGSAGSSATYTFIPVGLPAQGDTFTFIASATDEGAVVSSPCTPVSYLIAQLPSAVALSNAKQLTASNVQLSVGAVSTSGGFAITGLQVSWTSVNPVSQSSAAPLVLNYNAASATTAAQVVSVLDTFPAGSLLTLSVAAVNALGAGPASFISLNMETKSAVAHSVTVTQTSPSAISVSWLQTASALQPVNNYSVETVGPSGVRGVVFVDVSSSPLISTTQLSLAVTSLPLPACTTSACNGATYTVVVLSGNGLGIVMSTAQSVTLASAPAAPVSPAAGGSGVLPLNIAQVAATPHSIDVAASLPNDGVSQFTNQGGSPLTALTLFWFVNTGDASLQTSLAALGTTNDASVLSSIALGSVLIPATSLSPTQLLRWTITLGNAAVSGAPVQVAMVLVNAVGNSSAVLSQPLALLAAPTATLTLTPTQTSATAFSVALINPGLTQTLHVPVGNGLSYLLDSGLTAQSLSTVTVTILTNPNGVHLVANLLPPSSFTTTLQGATGSLQRTLASEAGAFALLSTTTSFAGSGGYRLFIGVDPTSSTTSAGLITLQVRISSPQSNQQVTATVTSTAGSDLGYTETIAVPADATAFSISGLSCTSVYSLTAQASNAVGSGPSASVTSLSPVCAPAAPTISSLTQQSSSTAVITFTPPASSTNATPTATLNGVAGVISGNTATFVNVLTPSPSSVSVYAGAVYYTNVAGPGAVATMALSFTGVPTPAVVSAVQSGPLTAAVSLAYGFVGQTSSSQPTTYLLCWSAAALAPPATVAGPACNASTPNVVALSGSTTSYSLLKAGAAAGSYVVEVVAVNIAGSASPAYSAPFTLVAAARPPAQLSLTQLSASSVSVNVAAPPVFDLVQSVQLWYTGLQQPLQYSLVQLQSPIVLSGLVYGSSLTVSVTSINVANSVAVATNAANSTYTTCNSSLTQTLQLATAPSAPYNFSAAATGNAGVVRLSWNVPASGVPIVSYTVYESLHSVSYTVWPTAGSTAVGSPMVSVVQDLVNGQTYSFDITAQSLAGVSASGVFPTVIPVTSPSAPQAVRGTQYASQSSVLSWMAPYDNGGSALTGYTVQCWASAQAAPSYMLGRKKRTRQRVDFRQPYRHLHSPHQSHQRCWLRVHSHRQQRGGLQLRLQAQRSHLPGSCARRTHLCGRHQLRSRRIAGQLAGARTDGRVPRHFVLGQLHQCRLPLCSIAGGGGDRRAGAKQCDGQRPRRRRCVHLPGGSGHGSGCWTRGGGQQQHPDRGHSRQRAQRHHRSAQPQHRCGHRHTPRPHLRQPGRSRGRADLLPAVRQLNGRVAVRSGAGGEFHPAVLVHVEWPFSRS